MARYKVKRIRRAKPLLLFTTHYSAHRSYLRHNTTSRRYKPIIVRDRDFYK